MSDNKYYNKEQVFWDAKGHQEYVSLSSYDQKRLESWIAWKGDGRVLDIGGGSGMMSRLVKDKENTLSVCVDISINMIKHSPVQAVQADALKLPFKDSSFDLVIAAAFFHHIPGSEQFMLSECYRVLKPGGRLVGYDPNAQCLQNKIFMTKSMLRLKRFSPDELPIHPGHLMQKALAESFVKFKYFEFSFHNTKMTLFELIQRYILSPISIGPLKPYLDRWFFWTASK